MTLAAHDAASFKSVGDILRKLAARADELAARRKKLPSDNYQFDFEQKKNRGLADLVLWLEEAELRMVRFEKRKDRETA